MKVFLSWSGAISHQVAIQLKEWLPSVIQAIEPFVSSEDIEKGTRWGDTLTKELGETRVGVICVTRENLHSAWLNYEAGSLATSLDKSRVMPFLLGLKKSDVQGPLALFQMTMPDKEDVRKLLSSINVAGSLQCIGDSKLASAFERWWPDLENTLSPLRVEAEAFTSETPIKEKVDQGAILEELLELARGQQRTIADFGMLRNTFTHSILPRVSESALDDLRARWASVALTAQGLSEADGRSFRALFKYIQPGIIRVLEEDDRSRQVAEPFNSQRSSAPPIYNDSMDKHSQYRTLDQAIGIDVVALTAFGGSLGDPVAAWIKVDGRVVVEVLAPIVRNIWGDETEARFRQSVRELAAEHDLLGRTGSVSVLFDPPQTSVDDGTTPLGEPIRRN